MYQTASVSLFSKYPNEVFIETGTYQGGGVQLALDAGFKTVYSIELDVNLYKHCVERFKDNPSVHIVQGDSHLVLGEIIKHIDCPITFWLDGHWAGEGTSMGKYESPVIQELDIIGSHHIKSHTIMIDDLRCWNLNVQGFDWKMIQEKCLEINPEYIITFADGYVPKDILIARPTNTKP